MRNKLSDLNNHLFAQLERLSEEDITDETLQKEVARAQAVADVAEAIVSSAKVQLRAHELAYEAGMEITVPKLLLGD